MVLKKKSKGIPRQAEVALGFPGRLRPQIVSTFGTTRVVGRQQYSPATFTPGEIPGTHFQRLSRLQGTWFCRKESREKIPSDKDRSRDRPTSSATPGPPLLVLTEPYNVIYWRKLKIQRRLRHCCASLICSFCLIRA